MPTKEQIRTRNWNKARLMGFCLDTRVLTPIEKLLYQKAMDSLKALELGWDSNTESYIGHLLKPHKCKWCGKRSNVPHIFNNENYCAHCYNIYAK